MASCENKYTTLLDLSRQAKVISGETACFNGKIEVGIPFSGYPTGVDTGSTVSLGVVSSETAVFSGNTGTTIFDVSNSGSTNYDVIFSGYSGTVWTNALFSGNTSGLTLPITTLSASTQIVGPFWTLTQTGMTGDYVIGTEYTGYSLTYSFNQVEQLSVTAYTAYSGFSSASQENFSAGTLDYKGPLDYLSSVEDATVDGRLTTNKITITNGASSSTIGFVLTQLDENGKAGWVYNSSTASTNTFVSGGTLDGSYLNLSYNTGGSVPSIQLSGLTGGGTFTGNTSGDCITDIHVSKIHSCSPLNINPLDEGNVYFGSTSGITVDVLNSRIGVGIIATGSTPSNTLQIGETGHTASLKFVDGNQQLGYVLTSNADGVANWAVSSGGVTIDSYVDVGSGTTINWDVSGSSTNYESTLTGATTLNLTNVRNGDTGNIILTQDSDANGTLTFNSVNGGPGTHKVVNGGGGSPTLTATANATDILSFTYNGTTMYWTVGNDYT